MKTEITLRTKARGITLVLDRATVTTGEVVWELRRGATYRERIAGGFRGAAPRYIYVPDDEPDHLWIDGFCCRLASATEARRAIDWVAAQQTAGPA